MVELADFLSMYKLLEVSSSLSNVYTLAIPLSVFKSHTTLSLVSKSYLKSILKLNELDQCYFQALHIRSSHH